MSASNFSTYRTMLARLYQIDGVTATVTPTGRPRTILTPASNIRVDTLNRAYQAGAVRRFRGRTTGTVLFKVSAAARRFLNGTS